MCVCVHMYSMCEHACVLLTTDSQLSFQLLAWILITFSLRGLIRLKLLQSQILDIKGNTQLWHLSAAS